MSEKLTLNLGDRKIEVTPENTTLYSFMGRTAIGDFMVENSSLNHVFVVTSAPDQDPPSGMYFFHEFDEAYKSIAEHVVENKFPMILNQRHIAECDMRAWVARVDVATAQFVAEIPNEL